MLTSRISISESACSTDRRDKADLLFEQTEHRWLTRSKSRSFPEVEGFPRQKKRKKKGGGWRGRQLSRQAAVCAVCAYGRRLRWSWYILLSQIVPVFDGTREEGVDYSSTSFLLWNLEYCWSCPLRDLNGAGLRWSELTLTYPFLILYSVVQLSFCLQGLASLNLLAGSGVEEIGFETTPWPDCFSSHSKSSTAQNYKMLRCVPNLNMQQQFGTPIQPNKSII